MSAWVIPIGAQFPDHWTIAREHGAWDLTRRAAVEAGDDVIFWLGGQSIIAWVRATSPAGPIPSRPFIPWRDHATSRYVARFTFTTMSEGPLQAPRWKTIQQAVDVRSGLNTGPVRVDDPGGGAYLRSLFRTDPAAHVPSPAPAGTTALAPPLPTDVSTPLVPVEVSYEHGDTDARRRVLSAVVQRRGQQRFRRLVLAAYGGACAITGSTAEPVLEAAHIDPYAGDHTQHVTNGLLLRSDLHTLFDLHLITVTAGELLAVSPQLRGTEYAAFNRKRLNLPALPENNPDAGALQRHRHLCPWVSTMTVVQHPANGRAT